MNIMLLALSIEKDLRSLIKNEILPSNEKNIVNENLINKLKFKTNIL